MIKKRSFIPLASLVVLSGIAAVSGTFAWFQTVRSATISFDDATIRSRDSNLKIAFENSLNDIDDATTGSYSGDIKINLTGNQFITDISGDGIDFYKLEQGYRENTNTARMDGISWQIPLAIDEIDQDVDAVDNPHPADGYFIDFTLKLSREALSEGFSDPLAVYVGSKTAIKAKTVVDADGAAQEVLDANAAQRIKNAKAVAGARLAISDVDEDGDLTLNTLFTQVEEPEKSKRFIGYDASNNPVYEKELDVDGNPTAVDKEYDIDPAYIYLTAEEDEYAYQVKDYQLVEAEDVVILDDLLAVKDDLNPDKPWDLTEHNAAHPTYLTTLDEEEVLLNFRMWIEGTDSDVGFGDPNVAVGGEIQLVLDLYTLHVRA